MSASDAPMPESGEDPLADLYRRGHVQAATLREQAREGGLRFEAYLPPMLADWLLDLIERDVFFDPSEAVLVLLGEAKDLAPHQDLRDELLRRRLQVARDDPRPGIPAAEATVRMREEMARPRPVPVTWRMDKEP